MAINIGNLIGTVLDAASSVFPGVGLIKDASGFFKSTTISPEQQAVIQDALMKHEEVMAQIQIEAKKQSTEEMKAFISESLAEINSSDKYTSRARPTGVYAATLITTILAVSMVWGVKLDTGAIATLLVPLWGSAAYYTYNRTQEKIGRANGTK